MKFEITGEIFLKLPHVCNWVLYPFVVSNLIQLLKGRDGVVALLLNGQRCFGIHHTEITILTVGKYHSGNPDIGLDQADRQPLHRNANSLD